MLFESRENRSAIWNELKRLNYFAGFKASSKDEVRRLLDNAITMVAIQKSNRTTQEKNSEVINQMLSNRDLFIADERGPYVASTVDPGTITAEGMREMREQEFSRQLGRHQAEFDSIINQGKPENIDFSDKTQEQRIGGEMETLIARAQQMRQMDLESAAKASTNQKPEEVEKWLNGGRTLKIQQDTSLPVDAQPITPRKVRFSETNNQGTQESKDTDDIFSRLKMKAQNQPNVLSGTKIVDPNELTQIKSRLDNVETKLETILESILIIRQNLFSHQKTDNRDAEADTEHLP